MPEVHLLIMLYSMHSCNWSKVNQIPILHVFIIMHEKTNPARLRLIVIF